MKVNDVIRLTLESSAQILTGYLADFSDADLLVRPTPNSNHIAWQLGHLISSENAMMEGVRAGGSPSLPATFGPAHSKETIGVNDPAKFLTKDGYLALFKTQRTATLQILEGLSEADLDKPGPEKFKSFAPTVGALMNGTGVHVLMHVGQIAVVRRILNKPIVM